MSQQDQWQDHPSTASMPGRNHYPSMVADDSSTFVNPLHEGSSQSFSPYPSSTETAIPPPPPDLYPPLPSQPKTNRGYLIALAVLTLLVVLVGSLEVVQLAVPTLLKTYLSGSTESNQAGISPAQHTTSSFKPAPVQAVTAGTIKENITLTCSVCNDPVLTPITSITIYTTRTRTDSTFNFHTQS